jgi:hypothetical protein
VRPWRSDRRWIAGVLLLAAPVACRDGALTVCTRELRATLSPRDTAIAIAESFTPTVALSSCGGRERLTDTVSWTALDPAVITVDPATGRVTGRTPGATSLDVFGARYGRLGSISVRVR